MKILFWICWVCDVFIIISFSFMLVTSYASGVMASKSATDITDFLLLFTGALALVVAAIILYNHHWQKTATLLASIPFLSLMYIFLIPIIAYIAGERMN